MPCKPDDCICCESAREAATTPRDRLSVAAFLAGVQCGVQLKLKDANVKEHITRHLCEKHGRLAVQALAFVKECNERDEALS